MSPYGNKSPSKAPNLKRCKLSSITIHRKWSMGDTCSNLFISVVYVESLKILLITFIIAIQVT